MNKPALTAILCTALALTGCGTSHHTTPAAATKPKATTTTCDPGDDSCIPPDNPSSGPIAVPALAVGQSMPLQLPTSAGTADVTITLTGLKTKPRTQEDKPGTRELCFGFRMRNTGSIPLKAGDGANLSWTWFGLDGEQADTDPGTAEVCDEFGHEFAGLDQPTPLPGKYVSGWYGMAIPAKPGALEVTDDQESPLFRLNYAPESAQVPIDARGQ